MKLYSVGMIFTLCLGLTACGPDIFYIPVDNKLGNAKPLSKTDDTIRVIVPDKLTQYVAKTRAAGAGWLNDSKLADYIGMAKLYTEDQFKTSGYKLVDVGLHSEGGGIRMLL